MVTKNLIESRSYLSSPEERAGQLLAEGKMILWDLYSPGLAVDGTNPEAVKLLNQAKKIENESGERPFVSTLPISEITNIVDISLHSDNIQQILNSPKILVNHNREVIYFGRFYARENMEPPIAKIEQTDKGELKTIVLLIHNNRKLNKLYQYGRRYKKNNGLDQITPDFLITGSSANISGQPSPSNLDEVTAEIRSKTALTIDLKTSSSTNRGRIAIIDFTKERPEYIREGILLSPPIIQSLLGIPSLS